MRFSIYQFFVSSFFTITITVISSWIDSINMIHINNQNHIAWHHDMHTNDYCTDIFSSCQESESDEPEFDESESDEPELDESDDDDESDLNDKSKSLVFPGGSW